MNLKEYFETGMDYNEYVELLGKNRSVHELHYKKIQIPEEMEQQAFLNRKYKILVITEPWCGDSLALLPLVRRLAEHGKDWKLRILLRDQNSGIMEKFLTRGVQAIPVFLFLDENYDLVVKWGPRPEVAQQIYEDHRMSIQSGEIQKEDVIKKIRIFYATDRGKSSLTELKNMLTKSTVRNRKV